jgi:hypothetical protein
MCELYVIIRLYMWDLFQSNYMGQQLAEPILQNKSSSSVMLYPDEIRTYIIYIFQKSRSQLFLDTVFQHKRPWHLEYKFLEFIINYQPHISIIFPHIEVINNCNNKYWKSYIKIQQRGLFPVPRLLRSRPIQSRALFSSPRDCCVPDQCCCVSSVPDQGITTVGVEGDAEGDTSQPCAWEAVPYAFQFTDADDGRIQAIRHAHCPGVGGGGTEPEPWNSNLDASWRLLGTLVYYD